MTEAAAVQDFKDVIGWSKSARDPALSRGLATRIRVAIARAVLRPGDRLPATRAIAAELALARGTVVTAIELLMAEGLLESRVGSGTFVSKAAVHVGKTAESATRRMLIPRRVLPVAAVDQPVSRLIDFRPCRPSLETFPLQVWQRCVARSAAVRPSSDYGDPRGSHRLRAAICAYLRRARGLAVAPDEIMVTDGAVHAMHLVASVYLDERSTVVVENPGYPLAKQAFELTGASILPCGVDAEGLRLDELTRASGSIRIVYVTPSHQFPTGARLSLSRRRELIDWAARHDVLILEDDYDGEFRYDVPPLPPMAAMPNSCVVYCGTFSKTLFPGLRIGFAVAPAALIDTLATYRTITSYAPNSILQWALSEFIDAGHYERHVHRMRRIYANKRTALKDSLSALKIDAELVGLESGLHGLVRLRGGQTGSALSAVARRQGVLAPAIMAYAYSGEVADDALVIGYAATSTDSITRGVRALGAVRRRTSRRG